jgi:hypothetical protein
MVRVRGRRWTRGNSSLFLSQRSFPDLSFSFYSNHRMFVLTRHFRCKYKVQSSVNCSASTSRKHNHVADGKRRVESRKKMNTRQLVSIFACGTSQKSFPDLSSSFYSKSPCVCSHPHFQVHMMRPSTRFNNQ